VAHSARYWSAHHTWQTRFFNVPSVKHWYTREQFSWKEPVHISFFSNFSWSKGGGSNSQSLGRQSSVLPLSQIPSLCVKSQFVSWFILKLFIRNELLLDNLYASFVLKTLLWYISLIKIASRCVPTISHELAYSSGASEAFLYWGREFNNAVIILYCIIHVRIKYINNIMHESETLSPPCKPRNW